MKIFLKVITLLVGLSSFAQTQFEKGYFINNNDVRTECLIKNEDWKSNPEIFQYKISEEQVTQEKGITEVKEFGIGEALRFVKFDGKIDASSNNESRLNFNNEPEWVQKKAFLKVLIEGNAALYQYYNAGLERYFYSTNGSTIEQLIYKRYLEEGTNAIKKNNNFQRQLFSKVKCDVIKMDRILKLNYSENSLSEYFMEVNNCGKSDVVIGSVDRREKNKIDKFQIKLKAGINFNSFEINQVAVSPYNPDVSFENGTSYKIGTEIEYYLPSNGKKWSLFFEPTYQTKYKSETTTVRRYAAYEQYVDNWKVSYSALDLALGTRYYMHLNNNSRLFLNLALVLNPFQNSEIMTQRREYQTTSKTSLSFGGGFNYKDYSIEFRYNKRDFMEYSQSSSRYQSVSIVVGYTLFDTKKK